MAKTIKHIHIVGIAGSKTAPLAKILKEKGNTITGSDQNKIFPPFSTILKNAGITINTAPIDSSIDLAIIGNSFRQFHKTEAEFEKIKELNIPFIPYTGYLVKNLIKTNSILVAGSYGKTTITGLLSYIFKKLELDPSYMFGGQSVDGLPSTRFGNSSWSIVEADENHYGLDTNPTFLYYPVKYLVLTSAQWEHHDSFKSAEDNLTAFRQLIENVPKDGMIIFNGHDPEIKKIIGNSSARTVDYQTTVQTFKTKLIGDHNQQNIAAAFALCREIGLNQKNILTAISNFSGIRRRLELIGQKNNIVVYDDFAQSASRVKSALEALKSAYPGYRLKVFFEPHASFLQNQSSVREFSGIALLVDDFVLGKITFSKNTTKNTRVSAKDWQEIFADKFHYLPTNDSLTNYYSANLNRVTC